MTPPEPWWTDQDRVLAYAQHLVASHSVSATRLLSFIEKPWKWPGDKLRDDAEGEPWCPECSDTRTCDRCGHRFPEIEGIRREAPPEAPDTHTWRCKPCAEAP